jgi:SAM-dependent methyltransferase
MMTETGDNPAVEDLSIRVQGFNLFLIGFLVLFLELASIRWFAANVIFLQFFTNIILLACFLGMSCGCMAARQRVDWLGYFPGVTLFTVIAAGVMLEVFKPWSGLAVNVHQVSPQVLFFGAEYRNADVAKFAVPIELIAAFFFVLIALMFVGPGQALGRAFDAYPNRVMGYTLNIGGSLAGIVGFAMLSLLQAPPLVWFFICCAGIAYLLHQTRSLNKARVAGLVALLIVVSLPDVAVPLQGRRLYWSPYYQIDYDLPNHSIYVDNIAHQGMMPFDKGGAYFSLIYLLRRAAGGPPFHDVAIIGAGSGNDVDHALHYGVSRVDAIEIDPVIQRIGVRDNRDRPYSDPRVVRHLDDGRHFLRTTGRKYDLVVYGLVDSLILHSGYANLRLESYLFTEQAMADIKRVLKPDGVFVAYNVFRQGWVVERVAAMTEKVFGCKPLVLSFPYRDTLPASSPTGFAMVIAGCNQSIANAFAAHPAFWLNSIPRNNLNVDGFQVQPASMPAEERRQWNLIAPTTILHDSGSPRFATDDWPFLYLRDRLIPDLNVHWMVILGVLGTAFVWSFLPGGSARRRLDWHMFFLGAGFMLLETKAVVQLALLFGSTWIVNSLVFFTALVLILLANLLVLKAPPARLRWHYLGLLALLAATVATPLEIFLNGGLLLRYVLPCALTLGPMFFAGVIFASSFRNSVNPDMAFGSNIAGSVFGGLSESFSMLLGFRYLLLVAAAFYLLSAAVSGPQTDAAADGAPR